MSRHDLQPRAGRPDVVGAAVGWDRPLHTFFAQVFLCTEGEPDEGEALVWRGTEPGELLTPEAAIAVVAPYADVPGTLAALLAADMAASRGERDGRHQAAVKRRLFGSIH